MMGAWSSEPYLLIQDEENSNRPSCFDAPETERYEVFEMRCTANVQHVNGYQPSVDSNIVP
jgi:hypothetical protein